MHIKIRQLWIPAIAAIMALGPAPARAQSGGMHWVATWATAQQAPGFGFGGRGRGARGGQAPATPPAPPPSTLVDQTARMILRTTIGGKRIRVEFSNAFGTTPVEFGAVHVALRAKDSSIVPGTDRALMFDGRPTGRLLPGATLLSDPVDLNVPKLSDLAVSVYVPGDSGRASGHSQALHTTYISKGDTTDAADMPDPKTTVAWYWISSVDVLAPADAGAIVAFGDSITDGTTSTVNADRSWPSLLADRLEANKATSDISVLNLGIAGNQVLADGAGISALARFDRDVLAQPGVKWLMILEGINDMNIAGRGGANGASTLTADDLIAGMKQMMDRAHAHGIKVIGCTLTPYGNATEKVEAMRQALNKFIRTPGSFDAMVDFDKVIQDPAAPMQFKPGYNNTDKLHPNDAGYKAMADSIDLSIFTTKGAKR
jgi:lysophospholipase L1-like esterase